MTLIDLTNVRGVAVLDGQPALDPTAALDPAAVDQQAAADADAGLCASGMCHVGPPSVTGEDGARG